MNTALKKLFPALVCAALALTGCTKKPTRPDPTATILGPQTGGSNINATGVDTVVDPNSLLTARDAGFDLNGQDRTTLQTQTVYFDFDSQVIKASERTKLQEAAKYLKEHPERRLLLEGHCDWRGTAEYNLGLGDRRAAAVKKYLATIEVSADKLETLSKGSLESVKNGDEAAMGKDRRVELVILQK